MRSTKRTSSRPLQVNTAHLLDLNNCDFERADEYLLSAKKKKLEDTYKEEDQEDVLFNEQESESLKSNVETAEPPLKTKATNSKVKPKFKSLLNNYKKHSDSTNKHLKNSENNNTLVCRNKIDAAKTLSSDKSENRINEDRKETGKASQSSVCLAPDTMRNRSMAGTAGNSIQGNNHKEIIQRHNKALVQDSNVHRDRRRPQKEATKKILLLKQTDPEKPNAMDSIAEKIVKNTTSHRTSLSVNGSIIREKMLLRLQRAQDRYTTPTTGKLGAQRPQSASGHKGIARHRPKH